MKRFLLRLSIFLIPFFIVLYVELFILPIDFFTFRVWESLVVRRFRNILPGPFYPNMEISKTEEGDLAHHTPFAVKKEVQWLTDRYGFRKQNTDSGKYPIVIVGDSNIAGSGLTQRDMFSEVLEAQLGQSVYPYAPVGINSFLKDRRFKKNPPELVIFAKAERELMDLPTLRQGKDRERSFRLREKVGQNQWVQTVFVTLDRLFKWNMLHSLRANLRRYFHDHRKSRPPKGVDSPYGYLFFLQGAEANREIQKDKIKRAAEIIRSYHEAMVQRGIRFIFLPIPEKENILHRFLQTPKPTFLEQLIIELKRQGIEAIDTLSAFEEAYQSKGMLLYHVDDSHWNANGVRVTAELIKNRLRGKREQD